MLRLKHTGAIIDVTSKLEMKPSIVPRPQPSHRLKLNCEPIKTFASHQDLTIFKCKSFNKKESGSTENKIHTCTCMSQSVLQD